MAAAETSGGKSTDSVPRVMHIIQKAVTSLLLGVYRNHLCAWSTANIPATRVPTGSWVLSLMKKAVPPKSSFIHRKGLPGNSYTGITQAGGLFPQGRGKHP